MPLIISALHYALYNIIISSQMIDAAQPNNTQHATYQLIHADKLKFYMRKVVHPKQTQLMHQHMAVQADTCRLHSQTPNNDHYLLRMKQACQMQFTSIEALIGKSLNSLRGILQKEQLRLLAGTSEQTNDSSTSSQKPIPASHSRLDHLEPQNMPLFESRSPFLRDDTYFPHSNLNPQIMGPDFDDFITVGPHNDPRYNQDNFLD